MDREEEGLEGIFTSLLQAGREVGNSPTLCALPPKPATCHSFQGTSFPSFWDDLVLCSLPQDLDSC